VDAVSYLIEKIVIPVIVAVVAKLIVNILTGEGRREKKMRRKIVAWLSFFGPGAFTVKTFAGSIIGAFVFLGGVHFLGLPGLTYSPNILGSEASVWWWAGLLSCGGLGAQISMRFIEKRKLSFSDTIGYAIIAALTASIASCIAAL
jgi:hypothetical protein